MCSRDSTDDLSEGQAQSDLSGHERRPSSFWMHESKTVFDSLRLKEGDSFLDLGCGIGDYALHASKIVGEGGRVCALDKCQELVSELGRKANLQGLGNIKTMVADITTRFPIEDRSIDVCLLATVLHIPDVRGNWQPLFSEIRRVMKLRGRLGIIECKKKETPFGPPMHMRLSAEEVEAIVTQCGFAKTEVVDLRCNYMVLFNVV